MKSDFLSILTERGFIHQLSDADGLDALLESGKPVSAYIGFDPTASSLHAGSLLQIMLLRWLQKTGHRPVILIGGGTARIGDPSGKDQQRQILSKEAILENGAGIKRIFSKYIDFDNEQALMLDNADWLDELNYIDFLREYGVHFSVNRMLGFESVKARLDREQNLSFLEFNYMVLQAYDFLELSRRVECQLQMGGSDQWGNIICGIDLARRLDRRGLFGLTSPLLTTSSGAKMGKTASGAIWLEGEKTSAYDFWQFWRDCDDADLGRFLRFFTELPLDEIVRLEQLEGAEINEAKKILAHEATVLCHGREKAEEAGRAAANVFGQNQLDEAMPVVLLSKKEALENAKAFELIFRAGLAESKSAARRLIRAGGAKINGRRIMLEEEIIDFDGEAPSQKLKLSSGKKKHKMLVIK